MRPTRSDLLTTLVYVALVGTMLWLGVTTLGDLSARRSNLEARVAAFARLAALGQAQAGAPEDRVGPLLFTGDSAGLAGADLLRSTAARIAEAGGTIASSQIEAIVPEAPETLRVSFEGVQPQANLPGLLYALETARPLIFIERLSLQPRADDGSGKKDVAMLRLEMRLRAGWETNR